MYPNRIIVASSFSQRPIISYGIALYCISTEKWLMVSPSTTPNFAGLVRGYYRECELENIIKYITNNEKQIFLNACNAENPAKEFSIIYSKFFEDYKYNENIEIICPTKEESIQKSRIPCNEYEYALSRFILSIENIKKTILNENGPGIPQEWTWPKGRRSLPNENTLTAALREFEEETGISSNLITIISTNPISNSYRSNNGRIYETQCWVASIQDEINVNQPTKAGEIGERRWLSDDEIRNLFEPLEKNDISLNHASRYAHFETICRTLKSKLEHLNANN